VDSGDDGGEEDEDDDDDGNGRDDEAGDVGFGSQFCRIRKMKKPFSCTLTF
jgi:hypothetical protein